MKLKTSTDIRRYLASLLKRVEKGEIDRKTAETLSNIAYKIQMSIALELKEQELIKADMLREELKNFRGG